MSEHRRYFGQIDRAILNDVVHPGGAQSRLIGQVVLAQDRDHGAQKSVEDYFRAEAEKAERSTNKTNSGL